MSRSFEWLAPRGVGRRGRALVGAVAGLLGLLMLSLLGQAGAVTSSTPPQRGPIAARLTTDASALKRSPAAATPSSTFEFRLWAQSSLGPLNLVVVSRSDGAPDSKPGAVSRVSSAP